MKTLETKTFSSHLSQSSVTISNSPNGTLKIFSGTITLTSRYLKPGTLAVNAVISAANVPITDNGLGVLTGTGVTGTINYGTGAWTLTFNTAPDNSSTITAVYDYIQVTPIQVTSQDTLLKGSSGKTVFETKLTQNIIPGSLTFSINISSSPVTLTELDGLVTGNGLSYGYVNYSEGYFKLVFETVPDANAVLYATYKHRNNEKHEELLQSNWENGNLLIVKHNYSTTQYFHLAYSDDGKTFTYQSTNFVVGGAPKIIQIYPRKYYRIYSSGCSLQIEIGKV